MDLGSTCTVRRYDSILCQRSCGVRTPAVSFDGNSFTVTCSDDFTGHAQDHRRVVRNSWEWTASASHLMAVDLVGGGGAGAGSVIRTQQTDDIEVTLTSSRAPNGVDRPPSGVYHRDTDGAGRTRYVSSGDVYHLGFQDHEACAALPGENEEGCWTIRFNPDVFKTTRAGSSPGLQTLMMAKLDWPSDKVPFGNHSWTFVDIQYTNFYHQTLSMYGGSAQITVELKPLVTSYGICGGSGGGGAYARAMVEVKAGRTYRVEAGRGGKGAIGGHGAESGQSSRFLEKDDAGEWHVLAEARGGFGAGSFDQKLNFSPGGQGGAVPNFPAHVLAAPGAAGQASRASLQFSDSILSPDALQTLPQRLFDQDFAVTCQDTSRDRVPQQLNMPMLPVCRATDVRRPNSQAEDWDYFVSCDVQCLGTKWPSSPVGGKGPTAGHDAAGRVGLMGRVHAGHGGNGSCPQVLSRDCQPTLQRTPGAAGQNGLAILRRMEGAYTLALQRCDGSSNWSIHGLWPRGVRDCQEINLDLSTLSGLKAELLKKWPSCQQSTTTEAFWQHEWQKHGTCLSSSPAHYFELALRLLGQHAHACAEYTSTDCRLCLTEDFELCTRDSSKSAPEGAAP